VSDDGEINISGVGIFLNLTEISWLLNRQINIEPPKPYLEASNSRKLL